MNSLGDTSLGHFLSPMTQRSLENDEPGTHFPVGAAWAMGQGTASPLSEPWHPNFTAPLGGRGSQFCISFPCSFRRFWCLSQPCCLFLVFVSWSCRGSEVQARGSIQLLSLCCHCCPLLILPLLSLLCLPSPALCLTLLHKGCLCWSAAKLPLNTDFSSWIF